MLCDAGGRRERCLGTIGDEEGDSKEVHFLNRLIRCEQHQGTSAILIEPDRRHVDLLVGMRNAKGAETPDVKKSVELQMQEARSPALPQDQASLCRSCVMRVAYLSQDRLDAQQQCSVNYCSFDRRVQVLRLGQRRFSGSWPPVAPGGLCGGDKGADPIRCNCSKGFCT